MSGYIKLFRSILSWEWYTNIPVRILFEHCLLRANHKDNKWHGQNIKKGSFVTSYENLAFETGLTKSQIRTALDKLKMTRELAHESHSAYSVITVKNWDRFQSDSTQPSTQIATNKNVKKEEDIIGHFDSFWKLYPRKKSKDTAFKAYKKAILAADPSTIMNGLQAYLKEIRVKQTTQEFIKHPATWLNQKCWEDEYITNSINAPIGAKPIANEKGEIDLNVYNPGL